MFDSQKYFYILIQQKSEVSCYHKFWGGKDKLRFGDAHCNSGDLLEKYNHSEDYEIGNLL